MAKKLERSKTNKNIAGVCAGVAKYFGVDPVMVRVLWVIAFLVYGTGLLAYGICWLVMPEEA